MAVKALSRDGVLVESGRVQKVLAFRGLERVGVEAVEALSGDLGKVTNAHNQYAMLSYFYKADADYGTRLAQAVHANVQQVQSLAAKLSEN